MHIRSSIPVPVSATACLWIEKERTAPGAFKLHRQGLEISTVIFFLIFFTSFPGN